MIEHLETNPGGWRDLMKYEILINSSSLLKHYVGPKDSEQSILICTS